ncbi:Hypothetical protein PENO1_044620 [Penicillium occitanis (nom. inval.)]|nr:Hypothetical protein PENO1_044620 [Penicillium occitanis (nom. inval.)]PCH08203.1 hypothetical protein PENOC_015720 [Penicillium occitanis (nom. inval.)]
MEVIPVIPTDQQKPIDNIRTRVFFIVDSRLDESVLRSGLDDLIRNHWRKLGARLFTRPGDNKHGLLEYRLPKTFDDDYQLFEWSATEYDHVIDKSDHLRFFNDPPAAEKGVTLLDSIKDVDKFVRPPTWPFERKDEPAGGAPMLYVHLSLYTDATVIALGLPHVLADQMGVANIMRAWLGLAYENTAPPEMIGYNEDVFQTPTTKNYTDYPHNEIYRKGKTKVRNGWEYIFVIMGFLPELMLRRTETRHIVFLPRPMLEGLKERYRKELAAQYGADPGLSTGDVVSAILTKVCSPSLYIAAMVRWANVEIKFSRMADKKDRTLTLSQLVNLRGRHPNLKSPLKQRSYIHNGLAYVSARFRITSTTPVREIAYQNRQAINSATPEEIEMGQAVMREQVRLGQASHICEPFERSYFVTNWCLAWKGLEDIFPSSVSAAAGNVSEKDTEKEKTESTTTINAVKRKLMVLGHSMEKATPNRFNTTIMCQTPEGVWCDFAANEKAMKLVKEYIKTDPMLEKF